MTLDEIRTYLATEFPQVFADDLVVTAADRGTARLLLNPAEKHLRPGGIISGPTLMTLADAAAYAALMSLTELGMMAVTTNLNISFLRAAPPGAAIATEARVIKAGRRLVTIVCEATADDARLLAHATMSYAMPGTRVTVA